MKANVTNKNGNSGLLPLNFAPLNNTFSVDIKYRDRLRLFVFVSCRWIAFSHLFILLLVCLIFHGMCWCMCGFCFFFLHWLEEFMRQHTRYNWLLENSNGSTPLLHKHIWLRCNDARHHRKWEKKKENFAFFQCVYIMSFCYCIEKRKKQKPMQKSHGFDFECELYAVCWNKRAADANAIIEYTLLRSIQQTL